MGSGRLGRLISIYLTQSHLYFTKKICDFWCVSLKMTASHPAYITTSHPAYIYEYILDEKLLCQDHGCNRCPPSFFFQLSGKWSELLYGRLITFIVWMGPPATTLLGLSHSTWVLARAAAYQAVLGLIGCLGGIRDLIDPWCLKGYLLLLKFLQRMFFDCDGNNLNEKESVKIHFKVQSKMFFFPINGMLNIAIFDIHFLASWLPGLDKTV